MSEQRVVTGTTWMEKRFVDWAPGDPTARRVVDEGLILEDRPVLAGAHRADLEARLVRLHWIDSRLRRLCGDAHDEGLDATWLALESAQDNIEVAVEGVRRALASGG